MSPVMKDDDPSPESLVFKIPSKAYNRQQRHWDSVLIAFCYVKDHPLMLWLKTKPFCLVPSPLYYLALAWAGSAGHGWLSDTIP